MNSSETKSESKPPEYLFSVIIPNWQGGEILRRGLVSIFKEARAYADAVGLGFEVIVCDDASPGDEVEQLREAFPETEYPELRIIEREQNGGFGPTVNQTCNAARGAVLVLCNNDLSPQLGFFEQLLRPLVAEYEASDLKKIAGAVSTTFEHNQSGVWATTARTEDSSGVLNHAAMRGRWLSGRMHLYWADQLPSKHKTHTGIESHFLQGGAAAVRSTIWRQLGGLDARFAPGYWEDYDFSHRLRQLGGRVIYTPAARAFHLGQASMKKKHGAKKVRDMQERNRLLFEILHGDPQQDSGVLAGAVARYVGRECLAGGPFHTSRALVKLFRERFQLDLAPFEYPARELVKAPSYSALYPPGACADFHPVAQ